MVDKYSIPQQLGAGAQRYFHVMAKPAGSTCNLDCKYCFYLSKETLRGGPGTGEMSEVTLELFVRQYIDSVTGPQVVFSWQGGEPTLRGLDFYRRVVTLQKKYAKPNQRIENDLQTNGVLLNEEWAKFLKEHRFLVGLSIDGPRELHDAFRINKGGAPTFDKVMAAAKLLRKFGVPFNTLTCVHRLNASRPLDVYRFLRKEINSTYIQFIPIVEPKDFETTLRRHWDQSRLPIVGSPEARPGHPEFGRDRLVRRSRTSMDIFSLRIFDEWRRKDFGEGSGQSFRDACGAAYGASVAALHLQRILWQGRRAGARWQRLFLRSLRLSGIPAWHGAGKTVGGNGFLPRRRSNSAMRNPKHCRAIAVNVLI